MNILKYIIACLIVHIKITPLHIIVFCITIPIVGTIANSIAAPMTFLNFIIWFALVYPTLLFLNHITGIAPQKNKE